ncbi:MAG: AMP-binding protein [Ilumatobacteraceae bacterium]|nr:AMP-binding protein [Ilumatobacteraceae bacterium]
METHFATIWESIADAVPDHDAVVHGDRHVSWRDYEDRSARLAQSFLDAGLGPDSKVGMFMYNCPEYAETQFAALKIRAVPVNVNYRYLDEELLYLLDNADAEAIVFHASLSDRIERVRDRLPKLKLAIQVLDDERRDGFPEYEEVVAAHEPAPRIERDPTDTYMLYTGGTTGMPKGVMYEIGNFCEQFLLSMPMLLGLEAIEDPADIPAAATALVEEGNPMVSMSGPPLMHGTGVWLGLMAPHLYGATAVLSTSRSFDPDDVLKTIERNGVRLLIIVGDAFGRPMLRRLEELAETDDVPDLSSLGLIMSSGAMFSTEIKEGLLEFMPSAVILDALGSTEGAMGTTMTMKGVPAQTAKFSAQPTTKVFDENDVEVVPGSGDIGMVANGGTVPVGYYKDPEKSARTFRTIDGQRYSFPGDLATVDADGTINLLGRSSQCINTGGEKVYPEEVEEILKEHPAVFDCLVFGVDDERFGQRVAAVASLEDGASASGEDLVTASKGRLASYKLPKSITIVAQVPRTMTGKADYPSARKLYTG